MQLTVKALLKLLELLHGDQQCSHQTVVKLTFAAERREHTLQPVGYHSSSQVITLRSTEPASAVATS